MVWDFPHHFHFLRHYRSVRVKKTFNGLERIHTGRRPTAHPSASTTRKSVDSIKGSKFVLNTRVDTLTVMDGQAYLESTECICVGIQNFLKRNCVMHSFVTCGTPPSLQLPAHYESQSWFNVVNTLHNLRIPAPDPPPLNVRSSSAPIDATHCRYLEGKNQMCARNLIHQREFMIRTSSPSEN